jgi:hypothetical protein
VVVEGLSRERELAGPFDDLLLDGVETGVALVDLGLEVLESVSVLWQRGLHLDGVLDGLVDVADDAFEVGLAEATGGHGWGADSDTTWDEGGLVTWDRVFVEGDVDEVADGLDTGAVDALVLEVDEDHVGVSAVRDEGVVELLEGDLQGLGVLDDLLLVGDELWGVGLLEGDREGGDGVVVRTALMTGEHGEVDWTLEVVQHLLAGLGVDGADAATEEDHGASWATQRLVGGGGHDVGIFKWRRDDLGGDETRDVGHVDHQVGAHRVGNLAHALVVDQTAVGRRAGHEDLGSVERGRLLEHVVVDDAGLWVDPVWHRLEVGRHRRDLSGVGLVAVGKMATVGEVQTHETVVRLHDGLVDLEVGWRAREGLDVDAPSVGGQIEGLESTLLTQGLDSVNVLVAAVISGTGVTLRILVTHGRSQRIENSLGREVLRRNQHNRLLLTLDLVLNDALDLRVKRLEAVVHQRLVFLRKCIRHFAFFQLLLLQRWW